MNHSFEVEIAQEYGVVGAILIQHFQHWIVKNDANDKHHINGRIWTYNSAPALAQIFPYLSQDQIRRELKKLISADVIMTGVFNKAGYDRTTWYAFVDQERFIGKAPETLAEPHVAESPHGAGEIATSKSRNRKTNTRCNTSVSTSSSKRAGVATFIPKDWRPSDHTLELIAKRGYVFDDFEAVISEFVLYWTDSRGKKKSWESTFLNNCKTVYQKSQRSASHAQNHTDLFAQDLDSTLAAG